MVTGKLRYLLWGALLISVQSLAMGQGEPKITGAAGAATAESKPVPLAVLYRHFFAFQNWMDRTADAQAKKGKDVGALRSKNQNTLGFTNAQFGAVRVSALRLEARLKVQDAKAAQVVKAERARVPNGILTSAADLPPASAELKQLQVERDKMIDAEIAALKAALGVEASAKMDDFLLHHFASKVKVRRTLPLPPVAGRQSFSSREVRQ